MKIPIVLLSTIIAASGIYLALNGLNLDKKHDKIVLDFVKEFKYENNELSAFRELSNSFTLTNRVDHQKASLEYCFENFNSIEFNIAETSEVDQLGSLIRMGKGSFIIQCKDGQQVFGGFEGFADQSINQKDVMIYLSVEGGTGRFEQSSGYLNIKIDHLHSKVNEGVVSIQGKINLRSGHDYQKLTSLR